MIYFFRRGSAWEDKFLDTVGFYEDTGFFKHIAVARFASRTLDHELEKNTRTVIPYFSSTFILMAIFRYEYARARGEKKFFLFLSTSSKKRVFFLIKLFIFFANSFTYSVVTCMMGDTVRSKPWLGLLGNVSAVMATAAAFGLAIYLRIEFIGINLAAPFLMIGEFYALGFLVHSFTLFRARNSRNATRVSFKLITFCCCCCCSCAC